MSTMLSSLKKTLIRLEDKPIQDELKQYEETIKIIKQFGFESLSDNKLKDLSAALIGRARSGAPVDELLPEGFALVREASRRVLGMSPFDVQLMAGMALHHNRLIEMQTGEGKTLAAVFPAYLNALSGKGVHILTFNNYLASRDAEWMGPVYKFLGLSVGVIREGMALHERQAAYRADVTYVTAKEAGFDYLRDFLRYEKGELAHRPFNFAIIDEADSILIDEARVPLVIAGNMPECEDDSSMVSRIVGSFKPGLDFDTDDYKRNVYLTEAGLLKVEEILGCGNLYAPENIELLTSVNSALHAEALLKKDIDYIVRDGKIEIIDEFTGRVADKRHWPDRLQAAVEAKEGLNLQSKGRILGSITLQHFLNKYPRICGMTATAAPSREEFKEFYGLDIAVIPTNKPCIRVDYPDMVFTHKEAKYNALVSEVASVHATGRPILIGTASIEESDFIAAALKEAGVSCSVLNAKNDELEAAIIASAGTLGAVTVSTNMAGRGTDIRLGGEQKENHERIALLGGLYVIGTNRHESLRIDNQLRGRAGRQGDPGSSRFFISLEDDLIKRFGIERAIAPQHRPLKQDEPLDKPIISRTILHIQKVVEGQNFDIRKTLWRYSCVVEQQRQIIQNRRMKLVLDEAPLSLLSSREPQRYNELRSLIGESELKKAERYITLHHIDQCWADHLDYVAYIRESIHLVGISGKNPLDEFHHMVVDAFEKLLHRVDVEIINTFKSLKIRNGSLDWDSEALKGPSSTWTYIVTDNYFLNNLSTYMISTGNTGFASMATFASWPILLFTLLYERFGKKRS